MAMRDVLSRLLRRDGTEVRYIVRTADVLGMTPVELYRSQPALRAVVSFLADNVAQLPLKCYVRESDTSRPRDTESALALLLARPNAYATRYETMRATVSDLLLYGRALWFVAPDLDSPSGWDVTHLPMSWISSPKTVDGIAPTSFKVTNPDTGMSIDVDAADTLYFCEYDPLGMTNPSSPIEALKQVLSEQISAWNFRNGVWKNGGRVSQYLYRPKDAPEWKDGARDRFAKSWKNKFSGENGTDTGGTPLLEDGMELRTVTFNAREAEWVDATRLSREDVAAVYHVNPDLVWHSGTQAYTSVKGSSKSLYADTLAPILEMLQQRINQFLVPKLGLGSEYYCEFDMSAKLAASFEEQASVLQSACGAPWLLRNEARARLNLPAVDGGDELVVPLNVIEGGLASPNDTDPTVERYSAPAASKAAAPCACCGKKETPDATRHGEGVCVLAKASPEAEKDVAEALERFYSRQATSVANQLAGMASGGIDLYGTMGWWDKDRWVRELGDDLMKACQQPGTDAARTALTALGGDASALDSARLKREIRAMCAQRADDIVQSTFEALVGDLRDLDNLTPESVRDCVRGSYARLNDGRVERNARGMATATANAGTFVGAKSSGQRCYKVWRSFPGARTSHARMSGERVELGNTFSNGAMWPGDTRLSPEETCNCRCRIEVVKAGGSVRQGIKRTALEKAPESDWIPVDYSGNPRSAYGRLIKPGDYSPANIVDRGNEWRDLFAHDTLMRYGFRIKTHGHDSIDISLNGELWEIKSFDESDKIPDPGKGYRFIESEMRRAVKQFKNRDIADPVRVVLNFKYRPVNYDIAYNEIEHRMRIHNIGEVIAIGDDNVVLFQK